MKKRVQLGLLSIVVLMGVIYFHRSEAPSIPKSEVSKKSAPVKYNTFASHQKPEISKSKIRDVAATPQNPTSAPSSASADKDFEKARAHLKKRSFLKLTDAELSPIIGQSTWLLVENYEAQLWQEERQEGRAYFGPFAVLPRAEKFSQEALPLVYDPSAKIYGVVTGELLVHSNSVNKDCKDQELNGFRISTCFAHLSFFTVTVTSKDVVQIFKAAETLRELPGITSVTVEVLSHFQEPQ